jgi:hypothetical protein
VNLKDWQLYLADVPHLLGNMPWNPKIGMWLNKKTHIPHQEGFTTFQVKDFYPIVGYGSHDPSTYEEHAKDESGYQIWIKDSEGNSDYKINTGPIPAWINYRMDMAFEGNPVSVEPSFLTSDDDIAGWHYLSNGYELMDPNEDQDSAAAQLEVVAGKAYDNRQTLYVLATTFGPESEELGEEDWWQMFALVPQYPYDEQGDTQRDYRLVSIQPLNQVYRHDDQQQIKNNTAWKDAPNLSLTRHQMFDSRQLRESLRASKAQGFTPTSQTISRILHDVSDLHPAKIWYKVSPFPGNWQSINTQRIDV